ncbi:hypothetical protein [Taklimakanibacter albus]|uniref:Uncharacterized protein n=1 Tax=Taklimakanibacter albus TaxID=2800327 RepID=A0ACC5RG08_9HYPH|nr:hypothetical protein [Aestuariivirga sp. YIM B02566]MBK1871542.1 hypothetical protein [Aestuariivirga sp. YIM B02566]
MSLVIYKDGILAADSGSWWGNMLHSKGAIKLGRKVVKILKGTEQPTEEVILYGAAGDDPAFTLFFKQIEARNSFEDIRTGLEYDERFTRFKDFTGIIVRQTEPHLPYLFSDGVVLREDPAEHYAIGAASEFALGALAADADVTEAVFLACLNTTVAHAPVRWVSFEEDGIQVRSQIFFKDVKLEPRGECTVADYHKGRAGA